MLLHEMTNQPFPTILVGDFNSLPDSPLYKFLTGDHLETSQLRDVYRREVVHQSPLLYPSLGVVSKFMCERTLNKLNRWLRILGS